MISIRKQNSTAKEYFFTDHLLWLPAEKDFEFRTPSEINIEDGEFELLEKLDQSDHVAQRECVIGSGRDTTKLRYKFLLSNCSVEEKHFTLKNQISMLVQNIVWDKYQIYGYWKAGKKEKLDPPFSKFEVKIKK